MGSLLLLLSDPLSLSIHFCHIPSSFYSLSVFVIIVTLGRHWAVLGMYKIFLSLPSALLAPLTCYSPALSLWRQGGGLWHLAGQWRDKTGWRVFEISCLMSV